MKSKAKKVILVLLVIILSVIIYLFLKTKQELEDVTPANVPALEETVTKHISKKNVNKPPPQKVIPAKIQALRVPHPIELETLEIDNSNYLVSLDFIVCAPEECSENAPTVILSKYNSIQKITAPSFVDNSSPKLVIIDKNNKNALGVWSKILLISTDKKADLAENLKGFEFQDIEKLNSYLYTVTYYGELANLNDIIKQLKKVDGVSSVKMDINFQQRRN